MDLLKKLCKYFIITLAILFVCSFVVLVDKFHKIEYDVFDVLETYKALKYFFILGASAFTASVAYSIGIAALFAFDKLKVQTWKDFSRKLAAGLLLVIPLSAMVYYCDWFVYPQMKKEYVCLKLEMTDNVPRDIDNNRTYHSYFNTIKNDMPMLLSKARLTYKLDSLKNAFDAATDTCRMYLSMLPDTMAAEASNKYRLGSMGVELTYTSQPTTSKDSLIYIQKVLLYQYADEAWDTEAEIRELANEYSIRTRYTAGLYISYILSALVIFLFRRYNPIKKILAVLAILIVLSYMYKMFGEVVEEYIEDTRSIPRKISNATDRAILNERLKVETGNNTINEHNNTK